MGKPEYPWTVTALSQVNDTLFARIKVAALVEVGNGLVDVNLTAIRSMP